jgi:hypothetical protein
MRRCRAVNIPTAAYITARARLNDSISWIRLVVNAITHILGFVSAPTQKCAMVSELYAAMNASIVLLAQGEVWNAQA